MKRWITAPIDLPAADRLAEESGLPLAFCRLCVARGLMTEDDVARFTEPRLSELTDPFALPGVESAAERLMQAYRNGERVVVFGDYDVDGITSTALLIHLFRELGMDAIPFIPDRMEEGYGVTDEAMRRCLETMRPRLIVTVDCGITSAEQVAEAGRAGVDVIITDHHEPGAVLPDAVAVINPKLHGASSFCELAGVGVAFKTAHGLIKYGRSCNASVFENVDLRRYLDLVALGTVCDLVPLSGENRILSKRGIARLRKTDNIGLRALADCIGLRLNEADTYHIGYQLGPRLNASGRLDNASASLELLLTSDHQTAFRHAEGLDQHNKMRRQVEAIILKEACEQIDACFNPARDYFLVAASSSWHPGVIGIVSSRIAKKYRRPSAVIAIDEATGEGRGSCRSLESFNMAEALEQCEELLGHHGGHPMAAGFSIARDNIPVFRQAINEIARNRLEGLDLRDVVHVDLDVTLSELTGELCDLIDGLHPFGMGNPKPVLALRKRGIVMVNKKIVGSRHTRLTVDDGTARINGIYFNNLPDDIPEGEVHVAFTIQMNSYNRPAVPEVNILDVTPSGTDADRL